MVVVAVEFAIAGAPLLAEMALNTHAVRERCVLALAFRGYRRNILLGYACGHVTACWPSLTVRLTVCGTMGGLNRREPIGGAANLMFEKLNRGTGPEFCETLASEVGWKLRKLRHGDVQESTYIQGSLLDYISEVYNRQ